MATLTIDALKGLYVALGGEIADVENISIIPDMLEKIANVAHAAATELPVVTSEDEGDILTVDATGTWVKGAAPTELPTVTSDDNGDVLTVVAGAWAKADAPKELPTVTSSDLDKPLSVIKRGPNYTWGISSNPIPSWKDGYCGLFNISNDKATITPETGYSWDAVFYNIDNKNVYNPIIVCVIWKGVAYMGEIVGYDQSKGYLWLFKCWNSSNSSYDEHILSCSKSGSTYTATFV